MTEKVIENKKQYIFRKLIESTILNIKNFEKFERVERMVARSSKFSFEK